MHISTIITHHAASLRGRPRLLIGLCACLGAGCALWAISLALAAPDYEALPEHYPFKSPEARGIWHDHHAARAAHWPAPSRTRFIATSFGETFVRLSGPANAPPLVLLPPGFSSSLAWIPLAPCLCRRFRLHAIDNIRDIGLSVNRRPVRDGADLVAWLDEALDKLDVGDSAVVMGMSFGGWIAARYAADYPSRLRAAILAAPAATVAPLPAQWYIRAGLSSLPPRKVWMKRVMARWMFGGLARRDDSLSSARIDRAVDDALLSLRCFRLRMPIRPTALSDERLRRLAIPALFLVGEFEVMYSPHDAVSRLHRLAPAIRTRIIDDAGHDLPFAQPEAVCAAVISFLDSLAVATRPHSEMAVPGPQQ